MWKGGATTLRVRDPAMVWTTLRGQGPWTQWTPSVRALVLYSSVSTSGLSPTTTRVPDDQATRTSFSNSMTGWTLSSARERCGQLDRFQRAIGSGGADLSLQESAVREQPVAVTDLGHA